MGEAAFAVHERFLVEDVILTLGNLRGWIAWLSDPGSRLDQEMLSAFLDRLDRQLELMQDRARAVCRDPRSAGPAVTLDVILRDALPEGAAPAFRSRRTASG